MATVRSSNKSVLLVVDVQQGVLQNAWQSQRVLANINSLITEARTAQVPVIWVQHTDAELTKGSELWQWAGSLQPLANEPVLQKQYNSAFENTRLETILANLDASHIFLTGAASNWCIRATAHAAIERGYDLTLIDDAHTTEAIELDSGAIISAEDIIDQLNIAITWLEYPDRRNTTVSTAAVNFRHIPL